MRNTPMPMPGRGHQGPFLSPDVQSEVRLLLRRMKAESGGTWRATAKRLGVTESYLSTLASTVDETYAKRPVTAELLIRVAFAMRVSIDVLLGRRFDPDGDCIACSAPPDWRKRIVRKMR